MRSQMSGVDWYGSIVKIVPPKRSRFLTVSAFVAVAVFLIASCSGGADDPSGSGDPASDGQQDEASNTESDDGKGTDNNTDSDAANRAEDPIEEITLEFRPGLTQLTLDALPDGVTADQIQVVADGSDTAVIAELSDEGTAVVRGLEAGEAEVFLLDSNDQVTHQAQSVTIPGEEKPGEDFYAESTLDVGFGYIETRDGTTLSANVILPGEPSAGPYPILVEYSGYAPSNPMGQDPYRLLMPSLGYGLVQVNVRGTGCSGGSFDAFERIQSFDGYDVIETVAAQSWSSNVGMFGVSYPGIMQLHVASTQPPSLAAIGPLSVTDRIDSILYPGGIYNNGFGETWTDEVGTNAQAGGQPWTTTLIDQGDEICEQNQRLRTHNPDLVELAQERPFIDDYSLGKSPETFAADINVPVFLAGGWQDEQTGGRFPALLDELENAPVLRAVMYNGLHVDSASGELLVQLLEFYNSFVGELPPDVDPLTALFVGAALTEVYGEPLLLPPSQYSGLTAEQTREAFSSESPIRIQFEQGASQPNLPVPNFEVEFDQWPPEETVPTTFYFNKGTGEDSFDLSSTQATGETSDSFVTDPDEGQEDTASSVDAIWTSTPNWNWPEPAPSAALTAVTAALTENLVLVGPVSADLWVSADDADAELEATISEVAPDGSETYVQSGWLQLSRRALSGEATELRPSISGLEDDVEPLVANGDPVLARIEIVPSAHVFRAGSKLKLTIDTPGASRPRWRFDISDSETEVTIHAGEDYPSALVVPVIPGIEVPAERPVCGSLRGQPCRP